MNNICLVGNLVADPELRTTETGKSVGSFTIAVNGWNDEVDFFSVVVWQKTAEKCSEYLKKGSKVGLTGKLKNRNYTNKEGQKVYVTEIIASQVDFLSPVKKSTEVDGFAPIDDMEVPF